MNAYELANELSEFMTEDEYTELDKTIFKAVTMLRQQADLIRNLQKSLGFKNSGYETINLTPQTKPLSDEEITSFIVNKVTDYELCRAIEERHGIK